MKYTGVPEWPCFLFFTRILGDMFPAITLEIRAWFRWRATMKHKRDILDVRLSSRRWEVLVMLSNEIIMGTYPVWEDGGTPRSTVLSGRYLSNSLE